MHSVARQIEELQRVTTAWWRSDPDWVYDGCAEVSWQLYRLAQQQGWNWKIQTGQAGDHTGTVAHVWLENGDQRFDPIAFIHQETWSLYEANKLSQQEHIAQLSQQFGVDTDHPNPYIPCNPEKIL